MGSIKVDRDNNTPLFVIYHIDPDEYQAYLVKDLTLSTRFANILAREGVLTVSEMVKYSMCDYYHMKGFGVGCQYFLENLLSSLDANLTGVPQNNGLSYEYSIVIPYMEQVKQGDFSFKNEISDKYLDFVDKVQNAYECLDKDLVYSCENDREYVIQITKKLNQFNELFENSNGIIKEISKINKNRLNNSFKFYLDAYTADDEIKEIISSSGDNEHSLKEYIESLYKFHKVTEDKDIVNNFIRWCRFDIGKEITEYLQQLKENEKYYKIISLRAQKNTLDTVGKEMGLTRERVRQIEAKVIRLFNFWRRKSRILYKIFADRNGDDVLTPIELSEYFMEDTTEMLYLLKSSNNEGILYDSLLDAFIIGDDSIPDRVQKYIDDLPETFHSRNIPSYIRKAVEDYSLPEELIGKAIEENYQKTGDTFHREKLTREKIYADILNRFYPSGMHIYDSKELEVFRSLVSKEYGITIDSSDRAMVGTLSRIGLLSGRGIYRFNSKNFISKHLANKICDYIDNSDNPIFMTNTLFSIFEDELLKENIDNKYFLQGILHDLFEDKWLFRRDYISKDESITTVYTSIVNFIRDSDHPVSKEDIISKFPGVTDIVISLSIDDPDIINLFGTYIHSNKLKFSSSEKNYLKECLDRILAKNDICHCKKIYDAINSDYPTLLKNNYIDRPFSIYSVLEYIFRDNYSFSRPFIAKINSKIDKKISILRNAVAESDSIEIEEIRSFSKDNCLGIYSILDFIDSCNDTHLLISDSTLMKIELTGVTDNIAAFMENEISKEISETIPIRNLQCINSFPSISVSWTEWLIYSVIKKWGKLLEVMPSDNKFKNAIPLISPKGKMDISNLSDEELQSNSGVFVADNLDDIDSLISGYVIEDE